MIDYMIDTHAHLFVEEFSNDLAMIIANAKTTNIKAIINPNISEETFSTLLDLKQKYPELIFIGIGVHPNYVRNNVLPIANFLEKASVEYDCICIGETGLDYYWDTTFIEQQKIVFKKHIDLASKLHKPLVIHTRAHKIDSNNKNVFSKNPIDDAIRIIKEANQNHRGVFHCFSGTLEQAEEIISLGFKIGIGGAITYKNSKLPEAIKKLPLESIVLETDSPYLPPTPHRGKRNEPSYIHLVAAKLAEIYELPVEEVISTTTANAITLFNLGL